MSPMAVFSPVNTTTASALPLTMLVPCKTDEKTACAEGDGTYGKEHVCHVLLHSSWIGNDVYCFVDADTLACQDGLVNAEAGR